MPLLSRAFQAIRKNEDAVEKLRRMYITRPSKPKLTHKHLAGKELDDAVSTFKHFDKNQDKLLNQSEFDEYIKWNSNYGVSADRMNDVFQKVDSDGNERISVEEFLNYGSLRKRGLPSDRALEDIFYKCDRNEDGQMTLEELRHALLLLGEDLTQHEDLRGSFTRYDGNKDGLINAYEFVKFVRTETFRSRIVGRN